MRTEPNTENAVDSGVARRHRSKQERRQIAEESLQPGTSVAVLARRHGVNANQVFHWRKLLREGRLDVSPSVAQLMPVRLMEGVSEETRPGRACPGVIRIELGRAHIHIEGAVDAESLRIVLVSSLV
jgi:transposase